MSSRRFGVAFVAISTWTLGCGADPAATAPSDASTPEVAVDGAVATDSPTDSPADSSAEADSEAIPEGACHTLANGGPVVSVVAVPSEPPTMTGGTIVLGTYQVTKAETFTGAGGSSGPNGKTLRQTIVLSDKTRQDVHAEGTVDGGMDASIRETFSYTAMGNILLNGGICGFTDLRSDKYTVVMAEGGATELRVLLLKTGTVVTFTKVP